MMWDSTFFMTVFDVLILCATAASLWIFFRYKTILVQAGITDGAFAIVIGLLTISLFYLADLFTMYGLPLLTDPAAAHAAMEDLHLNYSWYEILLATAFISIGFVLATQKLQPLTSRLYFTQFAMDHSSDCIYWMTPDARFFYINDAACQALGYTRDELLSMSVENIDPDFSADVWPDLWKNLRARGSLTIHSNHQAKQGHVFPVEIKANFIQFEGREYTCAVVRDITERKREEDTQHELETKQSEPVLKRDPLEWDTAASIAHELRTPLTCVNVLFSTLCNAQNLQLSPAVREELIKEIHQEVDHLSNGIEKLLDVSQSEGGTHSLNCEWHLFEDLLGGALRSVRPLLQSRLLDLDIPDSLPLISVDRAQIQQVLINLLENAVKYSREGSPIGVRVAAEGKEMVVRVTSIGEVISPEDLTRVFECFYRVKRHRLRPIRGIGLGLAICRRVIEAHGGRIWAQSTSEAATTFTFTLPMNGPPARPKPASGI